MAVRNSGTVTGGNQGIWLQYGGSVTNDASASIIAIFGVHVGPYGSGVVSTVDNQGAIVGTGPNGTGVFLTGNYGTLTNGVAGTVTGGSVGVQTSGALDNDGTIATADSGNDGVFLTGGAITNGISGLITGGQIGVYVYVGIGMIDNSGTIDGGLATPASVVWSSAPFRPKLSSTNQAERSTADSPALLPRLTRQLRIAAGSRRGTAMASVTSAAFLLPTVPAV